MQPPDTGAQGLPDPLGVWADPTFMPPPAPVLGGRWWVSPRAGLRHMHQPRCQGRRQQRAEAGDRFFARLVFLLRVRRNPEGLLCGRCCQALLPIFFSPVFSGYCLTSCRATLQPPLVRSPPVTHASIPIRIQKQINTG